MPDYSILGIVDGENVECYLSSSGAIMVIDLESLFSSKPHMEKNMEYYSHRIMLDTEEETDFNPSDFDSSNSGKEYVRLYAFPVGRSRKS
ncbi:496_t:CDS:2 [Entrophospora sp. SA101]|nr:496_t:CDS:2 [Entrophospora sp. SA101]